MNKKLDTGPYRGVRDFFPEDMRILKWMFEKIRKVVESYGYVEYGASILEPTELYAAKSGEEIVNEQTYTFTDRGGRSVTLRPEMTPTAARMVAARRRDLGFPLRWYSIPNLFRYENPQKGRQREHWQLNADIFGISGVEAEIEIISLACAIMKGFGAKDEDFEIRINDRQNKLKGLREKSLSPEQERGMWQLLDKKDKISGSDFRKRAAEILGESLELEFEESEKTKQIISALGEIGINNTSFSPALARGFDYYTGMIFEVFDTNKDNPRSIFGGGRYDDLTKLFDDESIPAVGFGMGDVTLREFLKSRNLLPAYKPETQICIASINEDDVPNTISIAKRLRERELNVATDTTNRKVGDKIKAADKNRVPFFMAFGEEEQNTNKFKIKELSSGDEREFDEDGVVNFLKDNQR
ncbi:MAG: histidine--tRNA ligase [Candidatus Zambryskibacteria bacterium RIFCSPHIGHO2_01_FULL_43_25]|uniref:Histidine--tRNA ligase n=1 Tax=Candidatus Zambryskibacteria bacterium RIFCSPLOWO2_01_FULL_45_21 TaxID=1802761 RepID=A0A1G2U5L7_9BACT|nr:MAG: histidine--tRNA ligase [Candidatus Zambryskibacteria bacterium RIFCSPHIGHO2_01_FULL_43_25]OHB00377.1 MAG: histidine--tRNA ligase [Candidatus Zambryskibacteria bacterium RIFCSPHIGHO2_12_FULL_44_12b]OHB04172.1 MAG: histidine--tRNA ligase [Candidatus Zambryskibacteria bacterium RIFCSPLOWO2_01_FULL_45_21]